MDIQNRLAKVFPAPSPAYQIISDTNVESTSEVYADSFHSWNLGRINSKTTLKKTKLEEEFQQRIDAIQNRNFSTLTKNQTVIGNGLTSYGYNGVRAPEFDLLEIAAAYDAEPLVRRAIKRQINLWFKDKYKIIGPKKQYVNYIQKRLKQIAFVTGIPTEEMYKQLVTSLLKYSNGFLVIYRNSNFSGGIKKPGQPTPIAGLFPITPLSMFPVYENGVLTEWLRVVGDGQKTVRIPAEDVIHFTLDREENFLFGKPRLTGVIEDIAALRRMEENIELLVAKFLFPIFHLKVGTDNRPCQYYPNGQSELDIAYQMIQDMEQEGMLITSERYSLDVESAFANASDASKYLSHFKTRLYSGLGVSAVDLGESDSANRSTATAVSQNLKDSVIEDQGSFAEQLQMKLFTRLFMEYPGELSVINVFDQVSINFFNVDIDSRIKWENHVINKFNNNLETMDEAREELGRQPLTESEMEDLRFKLIEIPLNLILSGDENSGLGVGESTGSGGGTNGSAKSKPSEKTTKTLSQPENQHGKNLGPTKKQSSFERTLLGDDLLDLINSLVFCNTIEEAKYIVDKNDFDGINKKYILSIVDKVFSEPDVDNFRAEIVSEFTQVVDIINDNPNDEKETYE